MALYSHWPQEVDKEPLELCVDIYSNIQKSFQTFVSIFFFELEDDIEIELLPQKR